MRAMMRLLSCYRSSFLAAFSQTLTTMSQAQSRNRLKSMFPFRKFAPSARKSLWRIPDNTTYTPPKFVHSETLPMLKGHLERVNTRP